jgi:hypothetical protein
VGSVLEIVLDRPSVSPGEYVTGALILHLPKALEVTRFEAWLYGHEATMVKKKRGKHSVTYRESRPIVQEPLRAQDTNGPLFGPGAYEGGTFSLPFAALLPPGLPPTFEGGGHAVRGGFYYNLFANVGVAWGRDPGANVALTVVLPPQAPSTGPASAAAPATYFTGGTSLELVLDQADAPRLGHVGGSVRVDTVGSKRLRSVSVALTQQVVATAQGYSAATGRKALSTVKFGPGECAFNTPLPFYLTVPGTAAPSYGGQIVELQHAVAAEADLALAVNPRASAPFTVT